MLLTLYDSYTEQAHGMQMVNESPVFVRGLNPDAYNILNSNGRFKFNERMAVETKMRPVLQQFGYSRLYIFLTALIAAFVFIFEVKDTTHLHSLHTMLDGQ